AYKGEEILRDLEAIIKEFQPTKIFVSHPLDWHPDHRSLYLFSLVSLWDLKSPAEIFPYLTHFPKWPVPPGYRPQLALLPPGRTETDLQWCQLPLTGEQVFRKTAALKQHRSQYRSHRGYLLSFMRTNELFGNLPPVLLREGQPPVLVLTRTAAEMEELAAKSEQGVEHSILLKEKLISLEKEHLVLTIRLSRPLAREIFATIHLFGYRADRPFSEMPKIRLKLGPVHHHVFSLGRALPDDSVLVKRENSLFVLKIPLKLLGEPERIFTDYATETENYFLERLAWRVIIVTKR
ncbi:MAG TPA: hypothetical protein PKW42_10915, partial [bacterium]|nr:hypothetical protein [bacterium]